MRKTVHSLEELAAFARHWLSQLGSNEREATVVGLIGDLGSGKTAFSQALGRELGIKEAMTSPTFVIQKSYRLPQAAAPEIGGPVFEQLVHIDAYRLGGARELKALGWEELAATPKTLILVEWADRVETILPPAALRLHFTFIDDQTREIKS